jgi:hypothetical protein
MQVRVLEFIRKFAVAWREANSRTRFSFFTFTALIGTFVALSAAFFWYLYILTLRYAAETGTSLLWLFGSYVVIAVAFAGPGWIVVRQRRQDERDQEEKHENTMARIQRMKRDLDAFATMQPPPTSPKLGRISVPYLKIVE